MSEQAAHQVQALRNFSKHTGSINSFAALSFQTMPTVAKLAKQFKNATKEQSRALNALADDQTRSLSEKAKFLKNNFKALDTDKLQDAIEHDIRAAHLPLEQRYSELSNASVNDAVKTALLINPDVVEKRLLESDSLNELASSMKRMSPLLSSKAQAHLRQLENNTYPELAQARKEATALLNNELPQIERAAATMQNEVQTAIELGTNEITMESPR